MCPLNFLFFFCYTHFGFFLLYSFWFFSAILILMLHFVIWVMLKAGIMKDFVYEETEEGIIRKYFSPDASIRSFRCVYTIERTAGRRGKGGSFPRGKNGSAAGQPTERRKKTGGGTLCLGKALFGF